MNIKIGIIGAGLIWEKSHKQILKKLEKYYEIKAFSVRTNKTKDKIKKEFPETDVYQDYHDVLKRNDIDAVLVLTPLHINSEVTIASLKSGKHVFVEKPLATNISHVKKIIEAEQKSKKTVFVLEQARYAYSLAKLKSLLNDGIIGDIVSYEIVNHFKLDQNENDKGGYGKIDWRINPQFPLGSLFDTGIHTITVLTSLFSKPKSVYAIGSNLRSGFGEYDNILMTFSHGDDVFGTLSYSSYLDNNVNYFIIRGTKGTLRYTKTKIEIIGEKKAIIEIPEMDESMEMWQKFTECLSGENSLEYDTEKALDDIKLLAAVDESLKKSKKIMVK